MAMALLVGGLPLGSVAGQTISVQGLPTLASEAEDRIRIAQLLGREGTEGFLLRTPSTLLTRILEDEGVWSLTLLTPEVRGVWNSDLPFSLNDGSLWAGRGWNGVVTLGARIRVGPVALVLAPEFLYQQNRAFQFIPNALDGDPARKYHANPFHPPPESMDYPMRFGEESLAGVYPGQSSLTVDAGPLAFGFATENAWWGPGVRNGILMSSQAPGVPRVFLRTSRPIQTRIGALEGLWILGRLAESDFFDLDRSNDRRTLNGLALTFQPAFDPGLTLGVARTVFAPLEQGSSGLGAAFDAVRSVGRPNRPENETPAPPGPDQILALFGRWVLAPHGFEVYGEWARFEQAASFGDFLEFPQHSQGYTAGFQWLSQPQSQSHVRVQAELTNLEPSGTWRHRAPFSTYASSVVPQGYTHRGQVIGAAIGPGSSSQWVAVDYLAPAGRIGAFGGRIRWDAAAWLTEAVGKLGREDVSLFWGLRGGRDFREWNLSAELSHGVRINYLFQTFPADPITGRAEGVDVANTTFSMTLSRRLWRSAGE